MMEKHPLGSQAFIPMTETTFLAFVAPKGKKPNTKKEESFIGIKAWLPKGCFSIIFIFIGNFLFFAEKILIIVFPFLTEVLILHKLSYLFA